MSRGIGLTGLIGSLIYLIAQIIPDLTGSFPGMMIALLTVSTVTTYIIAIKSENVSEISTAFLLPFAGLMGFLIYMSQASTGPMHAGPNPAVHIGPAALGMIIGGVAAKIREVIDERWNV